jgi:hypothetical protein
VVNAVSKASIFLGAADALIRSNIVLLRPSADPYSRLKVSFPRNRKARRYGFRGHDATIKDM